MKFESGTQPAININFQHTYKSNQLFLFGQIQEKPYHWYSHALDYRKYHPQIFNLWRSHYRVGEVSQDLAYTLLHKTIVVVYQSQLILVSWDLSIIFRG